jgi:hypothetical protein
MIWHVLSYGMLCGGVLWCLQEQADSMKLQLDAQQKATDQLIANTR